MSRRNSMRVTSVILRTALAQWWLSLGIVAAVIAAIVTALLPPLILAEIIDTLTQGVAVPVGAIVLYVAMTTLTGVTESLREGLLTVFGQRITHALRSCLMDKFRRLTVDELSGAEPGTIVSRFVGDVDTVENLFTSGIVSMFADACSIVSIMVVIWMHNRGLAVVLLFLLPVLYWFTRHVQRNMHAAQLENRRAVSRVSGHVPETLRNIRTIHCLGKEAYMEARYDGYIEESYQAMERTNYYDAVYSPVILICNAVVVAVVMVLSASGNPQVLTLFGMTAGTAVAVINYITQIFGPIESLGMEIQTIQSAVAGVTRINEFLALPEYRVPEDVTPEQAVEMAEALRGVASEDADQATAAQGAAQDACNARTAQGNTQNVAVTTGGDQAILTQGAAQEDTQETSQQPVIAATADPVAMSDVIFGYDERRVLDGFSMRVHEGEQVTLAGRTGAGKSTIFRLLLGLYEPQVGSVRIRGMEAAMIPPHLRRHLFGYVEQSFHLVPGTVRDQITLYDEAITEEQVVRAAQLVGLHDTIAALEHGYDTPCTPEILSQGQWQLLSIARAVAAEPGILLLDEITANLDADTEMAVLAALHQVSRGRTVLSISHRTAAMAGARIVTVTPQSCDPGTHN